MKAIESHITGLKPKVHRNVLTEFSGDMLPSTLFEMMDLGLRNDGLSIFDLKMRIRLVIHGASEWR